MTRRRYAGITAFAVIFLAGCLAVSLWGVARARDAATARSVSSVEISGPAGRTQHSTATLAVAMPLAACEARLERARSALPTVAIVGASYTAGVGPGNPQLSWAVQLARLLHWNAVVYGVPGAGYVERSPSGRGPMTHMLSAEELRGLRPALVIVQAGHDDVGVPLGLERSRVAATVREISATAPGARIALLTAFAGLLGGSPQLHQTNQAIVTAGLAADSKVIVVNPLAGQWKYAHADGGLHPTAAGDEWIAHKVAASLLARGVRPAAQTGTAPVICDATVGVGTSVSATTT